MGSYAPEADAEDSRKELNVLVTGFGVSHALVQAHFPL